MHHTKVGKSIDRPISVPTLFEKCCNPQNGYISASRFFRLIQTNPPTSIGYVVLVREGEDAHYLWEIFSCRSKLEVKAVALHSSANTVMETLAVVVDFS